MRDDMLKVSSNKYRNGASHLVPNQVNHSAINNPLHLKNKTMSNISIIDRISERQNRMEEKYFNHNIKQKRKSTNNQQFNSRSKQGATLPEARFHRCI